jgi:hypothetical protein
MWYDIIDIFCKVHKIIILVRHVVNIKCLCNTVYTQLVLTFTEYLYVSNYITLWSAAVIDIIQCFKLAS